MDLYRSVEAQLQCTDHLFVSGRKTLTPLDRKSPQLLSRAKRVTLYLISSFSMMYPQGPQIYTQCFPELFGGGGRIRG